MSLKGSNPFLCATVPSFSYYDFIEYLKGKRLEESTIEAKVKLVKHLASKYNLWDARAAVIGVRSYINSNKRAEDAKKKEQETRDRELETRGAQLFMGFYDKLTSKDSNDTLYLIQSWKVDSAEDFMNMWNDQKRRGIWSIYWMLYESIGVLVHEGLVDIRIVARYISYFRYEWENGGPSSSRHVL